MKRLKALSTLHIFCPHPLCFHSAQMVWCTPVVEYQYFGAARHAPVAHRQQSGTPNRPTVACFCWGFKHRHCDKLALLEKGTWSACKALLTYHEDERGHQCDHTPSAVMCACALQGSSWHWQFAWMLDKFTPTYKYRNCGAVASYIVHSCLAHQHCVMLRQGFSGECWYHNGAGFRLYVLSDCITGYAF